MNNPNGTIMRKVNSLLKDLKQEKRITEEQYKVMYANSPTNPLFYATIKVHKENFPIRPIVSFIDGPTYHLSKFLSKTLTQITNSAPQKLRNTTDFLQELRDMTVPQNYLLVSFDVKNQYLSIPQELAELSLRETLTDRNLDLREIENIMKIARLCIEANVFQYDEKLYKQIKGLPMGSPASVALAEITMQIISNTLYDVHFWRRYVDDCFAIIKSNEVDDLLAYINGINESIQFTIEIEENGSLLFLDTNMIREDNGMLKFKVYRKPTSNDRYLDYKSNNPTSHKQNTAIALQKRAFTICSDETDKFQELIKVRKDLYRNGYPKGFISKCEKSITKPSRQGSNAVEGNIIIAPPYIKGVTERVAKIMKPYNIKVFSKISNKLRSKICKLKDIKKTHDKKNVVYKIKCEECKAVYVGETGRTTKQRMAEHRAAVEKRDKRSHIYKHYMETRGHRFNFEDVEILATENSKYPRKLLEGMHTKLTKNTIYRAVHIPTFYYGIMGVGRQSEQRDCSID